MDIRNSGNTLLDAKLLVLEDDPAHAEAIRRVFADAGWVSVEVVGTLSAFRQRQEVSCPDLVLADMILPDGEVLEILSSPAESQPFPIVVMTSHGDEQKAVRVLKAGAFDYVVKSAESFEQMPYTLARIQREWVLVQEKKQSAIERDQLQRQLAQAQKMEAIGQLTGGIAHDFNNILGSILGYTDLAMRVSSNNPDIKLTEYLTQVRIAGERARDLVANMLTFTRLGKSGNVVAETDVGVTCQEVIQLLRPVISSSIQIDLAIAPFMPKVSCNMTRLHQALMNLCINARDVVSEHGHIQVGVSLLDSPPGFCASCGVPLQGSWLSLAVRDNGSGMSPEIEAKIFDPFYTTKEIGHGTGLGLSMVHGFVHDTGGHIKLESVPGKGTTIHLLLPPLLGKSISSTDAATEQALLSGKGQTILVVDDDPLLAQLFTELLTTFGYQVQVYTDSSAAMEYFTAHADEIAVVLTDYTMPLLTGTELEAKIHALRPAMPIILCTGYSDKLSAKNAEALGVYRILQKPIAIQLLLQAVAEALATPAA